MKKLILFFGTLLIIISLAACSSLTAVPEATTASNSAESTTTTTTINGEITQVEATQPAPVILADTHELAEDYTWDTAEEIPITLEGSSANASSDGVEVTGSTVTISRAGAYRLSGSLEDGQVIVDTQEDEIVRLILDGVKITSTTSAPIFIANAEKVIIILADDSQNSLTDASTYTNIDVEENEPDAALFSKANLTIYGGGELTVNANYKDGITSKDGLLIAGATITVNAVDDGIRGKDYLVIKDGNIVVTAFGDGLKSDEEDDTSLGYIQIEDGNFEITSGGDAIAAQTNVMINNGAFKLASGGGNNEVVDATFSAKGIKGQVSVVINEGTFTINAADDGVHSNGDIILNGGTMSITTGDDGMHADTSLTINGGGITIEDSYEGIESALITVNAGNLHINSSDDGINVSSGVDGSGMPNGFFSPGQGQPPQPGGQPGARPEGGFGQDTFASTGNDALHINGGYIYVNAAGDGIDVNGAVEMTDGVVLVMGPVENMNGALDYMSTFNISGGILVSAGSAGMSMGLSETSTQNSLLLNFDQVFSAGTAIHIEEVNGNPILTFIPEKEFQSVVFSAPQLESGVEYTMSVGGKTTGEIVDGLANPTDYSAGSQYTTFTVKSILTTIGDTYGHGPGGGPRP